MANPQAPKLEDLEDKDEAAARRRAIADVDAAANAKQPEPAASAAQDAENKRQAEIVAAVEKAHADELPKLGGDLLEPGLGR